MAWLTHRGAEEQGIWRSSAGGAAIEFGYARLRIVDLTSGGYSPLTLDNRAAVFNGGHFEVETSKYDYRLDCLDKLMLTEMHHREVCMAERTSRMEHEAVANANTMGTLNVYSVVVARSDVGQ